MMEEALRLARIFLFDLLPRVLPICGTLVFVSTYLGTQSLRAAFFDSFFFMLVLGGGLSVMVVLTLILIHVLASPEERPDMLQYAMKLFEPTQPPPDQTD